MEVNPITGSRRLTSCRITSCRRQPGQKYQSGGGRKGRGRKELPLERLMVIYGRLAPPTAAATSSTSGRRAATNSSRKTTPGNVEGSSRKWLLGSGLEQQHSSSAGRVVTQPRKSQLTRRRPQRPIREQTGNHVAATAALKVWKSQTDGSSRE